MWTHFERLFGVFEAVPNGVKHSASLISGPVSQPASNCCKSLEISAQPLSERKLHNFVDSSEPNAEK